MVNILLTELLYLSSQTNSHIIFPFYIFRSKYMEEWLLQKKMDEAHKLAQLRNRQEEEDIQQQMRQETNYRSYRDWLKK